MSGANFNDTTNKALAASGTTYIWTGYHASTNVTWARTNTVYGDFAADADANLTEVLNVNFGTVTSYVSGSDELPGIVFTPPAAGYYDVTVTVQVRAAVLGTVSGLQLLDGAGTVIKETFYQSFAANYINSVGLHGIYYCNDTSSRTLKIYGKTDSGAMEIIAGGSGRSPLEWEVSKI